MTPRPPTSTLFPYTTLFRSLDGKPGLLLDDRGHDQRFVRRAVRQARVAGLPLRLEMPLHRAIRSEEHTSELQSLRHLVCRLLLEKKKNSEEKEEYPSNRASCLPHP